MNPEQKIKLIEDEIKVLKNEIKSILLDIREHYLSFENPFAETRPSSGSDSPSPPETPDEAAPQANAAEEPEAEAAGSGPEMQMQEAPGPGPSFGQEAPGPGPSSFGQETAAPAPDFGHFGSPTLTREPAIANNSPGMSLITIAALTQWVERSATKLGKEKVLALLELHHVAGNLPSEFKDALIKLTNLSPGSPTNGRSTAKDSLTVLVELEGILSQSSTIESVLLSVLNSDDDTVNKNADSLQSTNTIEAELFSTLNSDNGILYKDADALTLKQKAYVLQEANKLVSPKSGNGNGNGHDNCL